MERVLRDHQWLERYRTGRNDVVAEFYEPAYANSDLYCRASGYFTSRSLTLMGRGLTTFTDHGGKIRLVASPDLQEDDITDINRGYEKREVIERALLRSLQGNQDDITLDALGFLGKLIAQGQLDIKLAELDGPSGFGIYHEKIGYFQDSAGDSLAFSGSANETFGGLLANFESIDVFQSWSDRDSPRAAAIVSDFDDLWQNKTPSLSVTPFPEMALEALYEISRRRVTAAPLPGTDNAWQEAVDPGVDGGLIRTPDDLEIRAYQDDAITRWKANAGRGILAMATGTGKTKTALMAASDIAKFEALRDNPLVVLVIAPYQHLVDQWLDELSLFGSNPIGVYESSKKWIPRVSEALNAVKFGTTQGVVLVTTNASLALDSFQSLLRGVTAPLMVIGDEVHNLGAVRLASCLPKQALYRMGLSATPDRHLDDAGTQLLRQYFGEVVYEIGLREAIEMGALCHYEYFPRLVELNAEEMEMYQNLTSQIGILLASGESIDDANQNSPLGHLLRQRAGILGHASGKMSMLARDIAQHREDWFQLVYCAEGSSPVLDEEENVGTNQLQDTLSLIGEEMRLAAHSYVSETPRNERKVLLRRFTSGDDLRFLIAMRCLDEGVDIPDARVAYILASSSNPRQFIQRRGRLLRPAPGEVKVAKIYDYLAIAPQGESEIVSETERSLMRREIERAVEFANESDNAHQCLGWLRPLKERYGLMDL